MGRGGGDVRSWVDGARYIINSSVSLSEKILNAVMNE